MATESYLIILIIGFVSLGLVVRPVVRNYMKFRGKRVIVCPETRKPAGVEVDAEHAAVTLGTTVGELRLKSCSRWPERQDCGQECLLQVALAPQDCLLRSILAKWYADKKCVSCGIEFGEIQLFDHKPAFRGPDGRPVAWDEVRAEAVPEALETYLPICWDCYIVETFCREHPELLVDRSRISAAVPREMVR
ncbi:MAG TPA: hypothetical protein VKN18_12755 [Blastocatellia bacterium]|nr:hypothetical protein [Blastocatellia bacterium]